MSITDDAKKMFNEYQTAVNGISKDLKQEIQNEKKAAVKDEYLSPILEIVGDIKREIADLEGLREKYQDPTFVLALDVLNNSEAVNVGDASLITAILDLPGNMLDTLAEQTTKPAIKIALLNQANATGNADLKKKVLDSVALPLNTIKGVAAKEKACLEALFHAPEIVGYNGPQKLDLGHQIKDLEKILTD